jgi:hypothetical protein
MGQAEAKPIAPTDARIGFCQKNRPTSGPRRCAIPAAAVTASKTICGGCFDATHKSPAGHYFWPRASNSLRSA